MSLATDKGHHHADAHIGPLRPGSLGDRPGLYGDELGVRPGEGQGRDDRADPRRGRARRDAVRYRGGLCPFTYEELLGEALKPFAGKKTNTTKNDNKPTPNKERWGGLDSRPEHIRAVAEA